MNDRQTPSFAATAGLADPSLPAGTRLGSFELQRPIARSASSVVYLATDHALALTVAIQEYLPARLVRRDSGLRLRATDSWHEDVIARGLRAFIEEARLLAHCDHPALVRVSQLFEMNGSAYRVMPFYSGRRLLDLRRTMPEAPDEASLRALLDDLLGALEAIHRGGHAHGGVTPGNILLLGDDRPLLLGPGAAAREIGSDLVDSLMASLETPLAPEPAEAAPTGPMADLYALAELTRFCITGVLQPAAGTSRSGESMAEVIARSFEPTSRPRYSAELLGTLDAAMSPVPEDWPLSVAQFRTWLARGAPRALPRTVQRREALFAGADAPPPPVTRPPAATTAPAPPLRPAALDPTTIRAPVEPPTEPMTTDRAPWMAPPARVAAPRKRRGRKLAMAAALAGLAVVVLAFVSGAWEQVPAIAFDRLPKLAIDRPVVETPPAPVAPPEPIAKATVPGPTAAPDTAPASEAAPASAGAAPPVVAEVAAPVAAEAAPASASVAAPVVQAPPSTAPPPGPTTTAAAAPDATAAAVEKKSPPPARPRRTAATPPVKPTTAPSGSPRAACAGRSEFALYRCMQQQCDSSRWYAHPQCIRLRATDRTE